jgi:preprotein translocase subunit Sec63
MRVVISLLCALLLANVATAENLYCGKSDCYKILDVNTDATAKQIKKAYYKLSVQ